ncbi:hypothetical protein ACF0H5_023180 [Mactra antiquata]
MVCKSTKQKYQVFLFGQAVLVTVCMLMILVYYPDTMYKTYYDESVHMKEELDELIEVDKQRVILDKRRKMAQGEFIPIEGNLNCILFRYDVLPGNIEADISKMVNEEGEFAFFSEDANYRPDEIPSWFDTAIDYCAGCMVIHGPGKYIASLKDVTIYPQFGHGKIGGENIEDVINQSEDEEEIHLEKGYFVINSNVYFDTNIDTSIYLKKFFDGLVLLKETDTASLHANKRQDMVAVIVARRDYANFYHATMDLYDVFLISILFKIDLYHLEVIWMDAHPKSNLDYMWEALFGLPTRAGTLTEPIKYNKMIWSGFGHKSHINQHQTEFLPFVQEFRHFVLSRFEVETDHVIDCNQLRITIIWRRHHVAHPRNPSGYTVRRIANEGDVWRAVKESEYTAIVNGVQLERLNMVEQLELISRTDILIGMHGAGLTHTLYLPKTSGVIEIYPEYTSVGNAHFRAMSKWRQLRHIVWLNQDKTLEKKDHQTILPLHVIQELVGVMKNAVCENNND